MKDMFIQTWSLTCYNKHAFKKTLNKRIKPFTVSMAKTDLSNGTIWPWSQYVIKGEDNLSKSKGSQLVWFLAALWSLNSLLCIQTLTHDVMLASCDAQKYQGKMKLIVCGDGPLISNVWGPCCAAKKSIVMSASPVNEYEWSTGKQPPFHS